MKRGGSEKRPWLAALLAFVHPGLGHLYLREWARALLWFGLVLTSVSLFLPETATPQTFSMDAVRSTFEALPVETVIALAALTVLSMVDAYWLASRRDREGDFEAAGATCPNCGKEVDPDIDFCHWCTAELGPTGEDSEEPSRV